MSDNDEDNETPVGTVAVKQFARRNPRMILREETLISTNGIQILPKIISETKFKGKGHELDDLRLLLSKTKHWAHRLLPNTTFEDFVDKAEQLGHKKMVRGFVYRLRRDAVRTDDEILQDQEDNDDIDDVDLMFGTEAGENKEEFEEPSVARTEIEILDIEEEDKDLLDAIDLEYGTEKVQTEQDSQD